MHDHDREGGGKVATRCKVKCTSVTKRLGWGADAKIIYDFKLSPIAAGPNDSDENKQFFAASPSGEFTLGTVRDDHFEVGKTYYADFTEAPA